MLSASVHANSASSVWGPLAAYFTAKVPRALILRAASANARRLLN